MASPAGFFNRLQWGALRHRPKADLAVVLREAKCLKADDLDFSVQPVFKLGYFPAKALMSCNLTPWPWTTCLISKINVFSS